MNESTTRNVDVAVIGAGTAGLAAYRAALKRGKDVLLIEGGPHGTTCARVGCMPSKLLIAAAEAAHHARDAAPFGVHAHVSIDGAAVMDRVRRERDRFVGFVLDSVEAFPENAKLHGHARFVSPSELEVSTEGGPVRVHAKSVVIATGSSPWVPPIFEPVRDRIVLNDGVFEWMDLPPSVAVFGAGIIGLEIGQALHRLGVRVRIFGRSGTVGPLRDPVVKERAAQIFARELAIDFEADVSAVVPDGEGVAVVFRDADGSERREQFAAALVAAGRRPNVGALGLENAGIPTTATVDRKTLRWGDSNLFVAGDASDDIPLLHEAADEGAIAGDNAARFPDVAPGFRRSGLAVAFCDPQIAIVGGGFPVASAQPYVVGQVDFADQGRSRVMLQNRGIARLYADPATRRFLGAEIVGPRAEHLGHLLAWALQAKLTIPEMLAMPFYHPVVEEGLRTALRELARELEADGFTLKERRT
jgi:dihydrolipoamide dehydrogenase